MQRGFTMIELLLALLITGFVASSLFATMIMQNKSAAVQLEYTEAQQNGLQNVQGQVDPPEPDHGVAVAGHEFFFGNDLARAGLGTEYAQPPHAVGQKNHRQG